MFRSPLEYCVSVWVTIPSARPLPEVETFVAKWRSMGYLVALRRDLGAALPDCDHLQYGEYHGYAKACNGLIRDVMRLDSDAQWFVTGGDDTLPDPNKRADLIGFECARHFGEKQGVYREELTAMCDQSGSRTQMGRFNWSTFGVMQPTGDRYAGGSIDRIAGSPWIGREFAERAYGGNGPYWPEYKHMFVDEEIREVALKLGVYWMRPDLVHLHMHFMRESAALDSKAIAKFIPPHLIEANSPAHWNKFKALYESRKAAGFPGHEVREAVLA